VAARPVGVAERAVKWVRRRPAVAGLLAALVLLVAAAAWLLQQRAERRAEAAQHDAELRSAIGTAVAQAESFRKRFHFHEARELLEQARLLLEPAGGEELRSQVKQARDELELVASLDADRLRAATLVAGRYNPAGAEPRYLETFARAGLGAPGDDIRAVAARVLDSAVCAEIVAALDDWASITQDRARREWVLAVARAADPGSPRNRLREPELWRNGPALTKAARELRGNELTPSLGVTAGRVLSSRGGQAMPLLSAAQERFPQDFWLNFEMGWTLHSAERNEEAIGFYRAALALRPDASAVVLVAISQCLYDLGRLDDASRYLEQALDGDPNFALAHNNLGVILGQTDRVDEAIHHLQEAIRLEPETSAAAHFNLGGDLRRLGRLDEAMLHFQEATRGDPKTAARAHTDLGDIARLEGRLDEAIDHYREAIRLHPKTGGSPYYWLANALRDKRRPEEAIDHLQHAVQLDPKFDQAWGALGLAFYEAARAAVADAAGQGPEKGRLGESQRAEKRRQALAWLRANLQLRSRLYNEGKIVPWPISTWQTDRALVSVRDAPELAKLPNGERAQWQRLWADMSELSATSPAEGTMLAARGDWAKAADSYARYLKRIPTDHGHVWFEYAALLLLSGDRPGYTRACAFLMDRCGKKDGPRPYHMARTCTLAEGAVADPSLPARLAEKELEDHAREFWSLTERGALAYRAGRYREAVPLFEKSLEADSRPGRAVVNWLWLAVTYQHLGKIEEARRWLVKAQTWLDQYHDGMPARAEEEVGLHLHNWLEAQVLRREAEALVRPAEKR
jgi:tetratricopeptide (TPR) repeat protein